MDREKVRELLDAVAAGALAPEQAMARLRDLPVDDLRFARVDLHRSLRHGVPEAVFSYALGVGVEMTTWAG